MARPPLEIGTHGEINTIEEANGKWRAYCRFRDADGETRKVERWGTTDKKAIRALNTALRGRATVSSSTSLTGSSRFSEAADLWLTQIKKKRSGSTYDRYKRNLTQHIRPALGALRLQECTVGRLEDFLDQLEERGYSANTRRLVRAILSGVLSTAVRREAISNNPVRHMQQIEGGPKKKPWAMSGDQLATLLNGVDSDERAQQQDLPDLIRFALGTGCRIGEICAVRWREVNLGDEPVTVDEVVIPPGYVSISGNVVRRDGIGHVRHDGKTFNAQRVLPLPAYLQTLLAVRRHAESTDDEPVFPSATLGWRSPEHTNTQSRKLAGRLGIENVTSHVYRKTVATLLDGGGQTARQIADQLGHSQVSITQDVYMGRGAKNPDAAAMLDAAYSSPR